MKIKGFMIKKGVQCLKDYGVRELLVRMIERKKRQEVPYDAWYQSQKIDEAEWTRQREESAQWKRKPLVSICVPLYLTPEQFLCEMIDSVCRQSYENWQLCLADGSPDGKLEAVIKAHYPKEERIRYKHLEKNLGIADNTNAAFALAEGEWIGLLDHDDILAPEALYESLKAAFTEKVERADANSREKAFLDGQKNGTTIEAVYSDEDKITEDLTRHFDPHFKPDYNIELLRSNNYITHFFMVKKIIVEQVGGFRREFDGSQDYDFILRCTTRAKKTAHVPRILYHWRTSENSTAENPASKMYAFEAGKRAIETHLQQEGIAAEVLYTKGLGFYRVKYQLQKEAMISVIVIEKKPDGRRGESFPAAEKALLPNVQKQEAFQNLEILSAAASVQAIKECICRAKGEYLLFLDAAAVLPDEQTRKELLSHCQQRGVAAIAPKLINWKKKVCSAGQIWGGERIINDVFEGLPSHYYGYMHRAGTQIGYGLLNPACVLLKKAVYQETGGIDEAYTEWKWAFADLLLRFGEAGYRNVYTPYAEVLLADKTLDKAADLKTNADVKRLFTKHKQLSGPDGSYHPNLSVEKADYTLLFPAK